MLEHGRRRSCAGCPSSLGFGAGGRSFSKLLACTGRT